MCSTQSENNQKERGQSGKELGKWQKEDEKEELLGVRQSIKHIRLFWSVLCTLTYANTLRKVNITATREDITRKGLVFRVTSLTWT